MEQIVIEHPATVDARLAAYVEIDRRVDGAEHDGIFARWEFGRELLAERIANGGKQLPHGRVGAIARATRKSERELQFRMQFAEQNATQEKVRNTFRTLGSWHDIVESFSGDNHRAQGTGENEWYTPPQYAFCARSAPYLVTVVV